MISVIVPVYNVEKYIKETISSILNQTYNDFELILVNDGSTDNSLSIMRQYENDVRVKIIDGKNYGAPHARNIGLNYAKGNYIMFFDSDDIMLPMQLERMIQKILSDNTDLLICQHFVLFNGRYEISKGLVPYNTGVYSTKEKEDIFYLMHVSPFPGAKLFKAEIIKKYNIDFADVKIGQDANFLLKYLSVCERVSVIEEKLCVYRIVSTSISHQVNLKILDIISSINNVKLFANHNCAQKDYFIALNDVALAYFWHQFRKYPFIDDKETKKKAFFKLSNEITKITSDNLSSRAKLKKFYVTIANKLDFLFLSKIFCSIYVSIFRSKFKL